jgi:phosphate transport system substrate-binding protein
MKNWAMVFFIVLFSLFFIVQLSNATDIRVEGVSAVWMIQEAADAYTKINPDISISITDTKSSLAIENVSRGTTDIAVFVDNTTNKGADISQLKKTLFAKDVPIVIVNSNNPVNSLDIEEVRGIFRDKIDNWGMVGGPFNPIITVGNNLTYSKTGKQSGYRKQFYSQILNENFTLFDTAIQTQKNEEVCIQVASIPYAIGYSNFYYVDQRNLDSNMMGFKPVAIKVGDQELYPTYENIMNESYPYQQNFNIYTRVDANTETKEFVDFLLSPRGQIILTRNGHVPVKSIEYGENINVSYPINILHPGQYYLTQDLTSADLINSTNFQNPRYLSSFIEITANNVIFDGMGHTITCNTPSGEATDLICAGVYVHGTSFGPSSNITIKNLTIVSNEGFRLSEVNHVVFEKLIFEQYGWRLNLNNISLNNIKSSSFRNPYVGNIENINQNNFFVYGCKVTNFFINNKQVDKVPGDEPGCEGPPQQIFGLSLFAVLGILIPKIIWKFSDALEIPWERWGITKSRLIGINNQIDRRKIQIAEKHEALVKLIHNILIISLIGAVILGYVFYYKFWYRDFDLSILIMFIVIGTVVFIVHDIIHYLIAKKLKIAARYRFWGWGIIWMIITTLTFPVVFGKPIRTEIENKNADKKALALAMMSAPLAGLILSIGFLLLWMQGGWYYYIGYIGIEMSIMTAFISFFPFSPMDGEKVLKWNPTVWALIFFPLAIVYFKLFILPI